VTTNTVAGAVEKREKDKPAAAGALVKQYRDDFASVLPSHIKAATWVRLAQGALKKGKKVDNDPYGRTELEVAACNNPSAFLAALLEAARLGLEPGTDLFYLTPRKVKGQLEILGIVGFQGHVELMFNAGSVASVVAEVVYANDIFRFRPGVDDIPHHEIDWDAEDRGALRLVYAFARMNTGATSKVVVLNKAQIERIKAVSPSAGFDNSPWQKWPDAMWLKSAVRQLQKWVPTSAELRNRTQTAAPEVSARGMAAVTGEPPSKDITDIWDVADDGVVDGEIVVGEGT
jgi:recombination protein RecT